ncbi:MAG: DUF2849 domain-containing protein [Jannaschia sp.]
MTRRPFTPKVVTGNLLVDGDVVYLAATDTWVKALGDAEVLTDEAVADDRLLDGARQSGTVVGVYLADVTQTAEGPQPVHFREAFRATGPTNYPHGKAHEAL